MSINIIYLLTIFLIGKFKVTRQSLLFRIALNYVLVVDPHGLCVSIFLLILQLLVPWTAKIYGNDGNLVEHALCVTYALNTVDNSIMKFLTLTTRGCAPR